MPRTAARARRAKVMVMDEKHVQQITHIRPYPSPHPPQLRHRCALAAAMRLVVSYDGREMHVKQALAQFNSLDDLLDCVSLATQIPTDTLICMTEAGGQITEAVMHALVQRSLDVAIYVFDRHLLYAEPVAAAAALEWAIEPRHAVQRPAEDTLDWTRSARDACASRHAHAAEIEACMHAMCRSTCVALANLQRHAADVKDALALLDEVTATDMAHMEDLLARYAADLTVLAHVRVSAKVWHGPPRMLGDYVSAPKMHAVADICRRELGDMQERHAHARVTEASLRRDMCELAAEIKGLSLQPSIDTAREIAEAARSAEHAAFPALAELDTASHAALAQLISDRNDMVRLHLNLVQDISSVQSDFAELADTLAGIDADLGPKLDGFRHIARLRRMLGAYAATLVEGVRRREFSASFVAQAQSLAELMARLGSAEHARRREFAAKVSPQLPWAVTGLETTVPQLEISTRRDTGGAEITRRDIDELQHELAELAARLEPAAAAPIAEARAHIAALAPSEDPHESFAAAVRRALVQTPPSDASSSSDEECAPAHPPPDDLLARERALHLDTQAQLARVTSERDALRARHDSARDDVAAAERERDAARQAHDAVTARLNALLARGTSAEARIDELHRTLVYTQAELADARTQCARLQADSRSPVSHRRMEAELRERTIQMARLHDEVNAARSAADVLQGQLHSADELQYVMKTQLQGAQAGAVHTEAARERAERECAAVAAAAVELVRAAAQVHAAARPDARPDVLAMLQSDDTAGVQRVLREFDTPGFVRDVHMQLESLAGLAQKWQRAYRAANDKYVKAAAAARERIALHDFEVGALALFIPNGGAWAALNIGAPHCFLQMTDALRAHLAGRAWLLARIVGIETHIAEPRNAYNLPAHTDYALLDVDGWQDAEALLRTQAVHHTRSVSDPFVAQRADVPMHMLLPAPAHVTSRIVCTEQASARFSLPEHE